MEAQIEEINRVYCYYPEMADHVTAFELIQQYPNNPNWNWYHLSKNTCLTWDFIVQDHTRIWDWTAIQDNKGILSRGIPWDFIESSTDIQWNWEKLHRNKGASDITNYMEYN